LSQSSFSTANTWVGLVLAALLAGVVTWFLSRSIQQDLAAHGGKMMTALTASEQHAHEQRSAVLVLLTTAIALLLGWGIMTAVTTAANFRHPRRDYRGSARRLAGAGRRRHADHGCAQSP
jgi:hypothetical protein